MLGTARLEANAGAQVAIPDLGQSTVIGAGRDRNQRLRRDRVEVGAKVHRALDRDDALLVRLHADVAQDGLVQSLAARTADDHAQVGALVDDAQQRHRPELRVRIQLHLAGEDEIAVTERLDP